MLPRADRVGHDVRMLAVRQRPLADRLDAATVSSPDVEAVARAVFTTVAADVPFAFACLATVDPASELITQAFKSHPLPMGDEDFSAAEYGAPDVNQFAEIARRPVPVGVLSVDTGGRVDECRRHREFMAPVFGFTDELRLSCRAGGTTWAAIALYRGPGEPAFTRQDGELLAGVHELVADRVRRALFASAPGGTANGGPAVLVVDGQDRVTSTTAAVEQHIDELGGWDHGSLPANLLALTALVRGSGQPAATRVRGRSGRWLALQALALDGPPGDRSLVVSIDTAPASAVGQMRLAARGLTVREQDVARLVLQGASTKDIAASLFLSPHTVQDHLKAIFAKLGVSSRREMIAQLVLVTDAS